MLSRIPRALPAVQLIADCTSGTVLLLQQQRQVSQLSLTNKASKAGPGGRSSVSGLTVTVFGSNGFVGRYVANAFAKCGSQVICPFRCSEDDMMVLKQMGDLGQMVLLKDFSIRNDEMVKYAIHRSNVVINLIGNQTETWNYTFEEAHADWPAKLAKFAAASPLCERFIHFSDAGADLNHPSRRMRTKAQGDAAVVEAFPNATIFKPNFVVGAEDTFFNTFVDQTKQNPAFVMVNGGTTRVQPTYVHDVAEAVLASLQTEDSLGKTYYLSGPETLAWREIADLIRLTLTKGDDETVSVPSWLAKRMFAFNDRLYRMIPRRKGHPFFTADFVDELSRDKLAPAGAPGYAELSIAPQKVTEGLAIEPVRYSRTGGYRLGDTKAIAKNIPDHVKRYFGLETWVKTAV